MTDTVATLRTAAAKHGGSHVEARMCNREVSAWLQKSVLALFMCLKPFVVNTVRCMYGCRERRGIFVLPIAMDPVVS